MIKEIFKMSLEICRTKWIYHFLLQLNVGGLVFFFLKNGSKVFCHISHHRTDVS